MTLALVILCLSLVGLLAYRERVGAGERERAQERLVEADATATRAILHLIDRHNEERANHAVERRELYQRIQAPEVAVAEAVREKRGPYVRREPAGHDHDIAAGAGKEDSEVESG